MRAGGSKWKVVDVRGKVAQPAHRVKDKRLRRAFGILDAARWLCSGMVKGLSPTPVIQG